MLYKWGCTGVKTLISNSPCHEPSSLEQRHWHFVTTGTSYDTWTGNFFVANHVHPQYGTLLTLTSSIQQRYHVRVSLTATMCTVLCSTYVCSIRKYISNEPHGWFWGENVGVAHHELLEDVILDGASQLGLLRSLYKITRWCHITVNTYHMSFWMVPAGMNFVNSPAFFSDSAK